MSRDVIEAHEAITIKKDAIRAMACKDRAIANLGRAEVAMLMPNMDKRYAKPVPAMPPAMLWSLAPGTIVRDHDLEAADRSDVQASAAPPPARPRGYKS